VGDVLAELRSKPPSAQIVYFYVLDSDSKLVGVIPTRRLLMSALDRRVSSIMVKGVVCLPESATLRTACEEFLRHRFLALPVVDGEGRLLGIVDITRFTDEMLNVAERQSFDDVFQLIGVHLALGRKAPAWMSFKDRFPWLLCNIAGGIACALIASLYEVFLNRIIILVLFIPVVLALAESVSIQSVTITLQSLHGERTTGRMFWRSLVRELVVAAMLGAACGGVVGIIDWLWKGQAVVAFTIACSVFLSMVTACVVGVALPSLLHVLQRDPKVAAGPIVLAIVDVMTLTFYFNVAGLILA